MRVNLTKKEIINSVFMQIGYSKKMSESILEDILTDIVKNLKKHKVVKISNFGTFHIRFKKRRVGRNPKTKEVLKLAVKRMLPGGPLGKKQLSKLKVYVGEKHPHESQNPVLIDVSKLNNKNIVRN